METGSSSNPKLAHPLRRFLFRATAGLMGLGLLVAAGAAGWFYWRCRSSLPQLDGTIALSDLVSPVEVLRDARGVPHLRAHSLADLMFAQGYVTAQDRLWQMDLSRRLAFGNLSEIFGERTLKLDIENRTLGFRQVAERAVEELDPDSKKLLTSYARGVNAFISTHLNRLPIEFLLLRYQPGWWQPADSFGVALNMTKTLSTRWPDELMRERIRAKISPELYADLFPDHSPYDHPVAEPVALPASHSLNATAPVARASRPRPLLAQSVPGMQSAGKMPVLPNEGLPDLARLDPTLAAIFSPANEIAAGLGSNNWVVSGAHTRSGRPLLANDPHLSHSIPSVWYMIHLKGDGINVAGVSLPGLPLVVIGHNERIAWGVTNTGPDVQDLFAESFNLNDPDKYLHGADWVEAEVRREVIKVHKASDYEFTVKTTRHGPVISHEGNRDLALEWTALEPHALRFPFLKIDRAQNWAEFTDALRDFTGPMQNFVYADTDGNIGYYAAGWVPIRGHGDGSVPSIGSTDDNDWMGYIPFEILPHAFNPPGGFIATANGRVVPQDYPYLITTDWSSSYRTARIFQLLEAGKNLAVGDMLRIQMDIHSVEDAHLAKQLVAAGAAHPPQSMEARSALSLLGQWDGEASMDSASTLVCEVTRPLMLARLLRPKLGDDLFTYHWGLSQTFVDNVLENNWTRWLPPGDSDFNVTLIESLEDAVRDIPARIGSHDLKSWAWGNTIPLTFHHPLDSVPFLKGLLDVGPYPQMGMSTTVKATTPTSGPSMRIIVDFADLDQSVNNITLGESGQVFSPYYKDQFDAWYSGRSFPMLFSDAAVEGGAAHRLVLATEGNER